MSTGSTEVRTTNSQMYNLQVSPTVINNRSFHPKTGPESTEKQHQTPLRTTPTIMYMRREGGFFDSAIFRTFEYL